MRDLEQIFRIFFDFTFCLNFQFISRISYRTLRMFGPRLFEPQSFAKLSTFGNRTIQKFQIKQIERLQNL